MEANRQRDIPMHDKFETRMLQKSLKEKGEQREVVGKKNYMEVLDKVSKEDKDRK